MGRLIDKGNTTLFVTNRKAVDTDLGREVKDMPPIIVTGVTVQPVSEDETATAAGATIKAIARGTWPGDTSCTVYIPTGHYRGHWDQVGPTRYYDNSPRTAHYNVFLRSRGVKVRPT